MFATRRFGKRNRGTTGDVPEDYLKSSTVRGLPSKGLAAPSSYLAGCMLVSLGIFTSATGGSWDITNHLLNKPESFFSSPHAMLYAGVGSAILGCVFMFRARDYMYRIYRSFRTSTRLVIVGITMLVVAGPVDFAWHSAFGLDGLLSPPHFVLIMGLAISSLGSLIGLILYIGRQELNGGLYFGNFKPPRHKRIWVSLDFVRSRVFLFLPTLGIVPLWLSLAGMIGMFSLPFSKTQYFDFNPEPYFGAVVATLGYPVLLSFILIASFRLANERLGILSITASIYMVISTVTVIIPNEWLVHTIPFYIINLVPVIAVDVLFATSKHRIIYIIGGGLLGSVFFMMQYPLITHVYNEVVTKQAFVWPSLTSSTYFEMFGQLYPFVALPGFTMGIIGALLANRIVPKNIGLSPKDKAIGGTLE
jgi:hypothetical protein